MNVDKLKWGTTAEHKLGDISRPEGDYFFADLEAEDHWVGAWVTGYGFINVKFPKTGVRELTDDERDFMAQRELRLR